MTLPTLPALWQSWRVYLLVFVGGAIGGIALEYRIMRPTVVVETPAPAVRQRDSSLVLQRVPTAKAGPAQVIPKGATVERVVHVEVQPHAEVVPAGSSDSLKAGIKPPAVINLENKTAVGNNSLAVACPPVGVDLTLIKLKDGTQRVVASSRDGIVLDSVSIDRPVVPDVIPKVLVWDAGAVYGSVAQWGGYVGRQLGPAHVALAGLPAKGREPARAMLMIGLRF